MKQFVTIGVLLNAIFLLFFAKAAWFSSTTFALKSPPLPARSSSDSSMTAISSEQHSGKFSKKDSLTLRKEAFERYFPNTPNDTIKRILFIGDSQLENLRKPIRKKLMDNNYELVGSIIWYGSSTKQWASSDTLNYFMVKYKPDFVIIALGLNELFVNDMDKRTAYAKRIKSKLESAHMPYYFIGPAAWVKDKGITTVLQNTFGDLFFPSHTMNLARAADGRHPSKDGAEVWFEQVAKQMTAKGILNLTQRKDSIYAGNSPTILLQVPKE
jgi:hypothetical protein